MFENKIKGTTIVELMAVVAIIAVTTAFFVTMGDYFVNDHRAKKEGIRYYESIGTEIVIQQNMSRYSDLLGEGIASHSNKGGFEYYRRSISTAADAKIEDYEGEKDAELILCGFDIDSQGKVQDSDWQVIFRWGKRVREGGKQSKARDLYIYYDNWKKDIKPAEPSRSEKRHNGVRINPIGTQVIECQFFGKGFGGEKIQDEDAPPGMASKLNKNEWIMVKYTMIDEYSYENAGFGGNDPIYTNVSYFHIRNRNNLNLAGSTYRCDD